MENQNTNEEKTGIKSVEGNTVTITDVDKFNDHLQKTTEMIKETRKKIEEVGKKPEVDPLRIMDVALNPLHLACLDDDTRPNFKLIEIKNNVASATNGRILVKVDLSKVTNMTPEMLAILNGKYIHMSVFKEIHKCEWLSLDDDQIHCFKNDIVKTFEYSNPQGEFFAMNTVVQNAELSGEDKRRMVCYDVKMIALIGTIFTSEILYFNFNKAHGTFLHPGIDSGMFALLPEVQIEPKDANRYFFI